MIHIGRNGTKLGAFSEEEIRGGLKTGRFSLTDLGWKVGMDNWQPLSQFPELTAPPELPPVEEEAESTPEPAAEPAPEQRRGLPWDSRAELGSMVALAATARLVITNPAYAFSQMLQTGPLKGPLVYNLIGGWIGLIASGIYAIFIARMQTPHPANLTPTQQMLLLTPARAMHETMFFLFFGPIIVTISTAVSAGIAHLFLMLMGGANHPYKTSLRVFCYAYGSTQLLQLLPFCGNVLAPIWFLVTCIIGLAKAHETTTARALGAGLLMLGSMCLCCAGVFALAYYSGT